MKKVYIVPHIEVAACILESFIATSPGQGGDTTVDEDKSTVTTTDDDDFGKMHAKGFAAWESWDE